MAVTLADADRAVAAAEAAGVVLQVGFNRPALRTGRARLRASGAPRVPAGYAVVAGTLAHGVGMLSARQR